MKIKVGVFFGGESVEHEVSIISANQAMNALNDNKYEVIPVYITKTREWYTGDILKDIKNYKDINELLKKAIRINLVLNDKGKVVLQKTGLLNKAVTELDVAFPVIHGTNGEDGSLQGYFEMLGLPYVGCSVGAAAVGQDKVFMKNILRDSNLPITNYEWFYASEYVENHDNLMEKLNKLTYPLIVKPASLGSSVGISKAKNESELEEAIEEAIRYDKKIIVEECVSNLLEVNCSVIGDNDTQTPSVIEEVMSTDEFLSYKDKYLGGGKTKGASKGMASTNRIIPARISDEMTKEIQEYAKSTFRVLSSGGVARIDFLIDRETNRVFVNEINTIPGSLSFYLWEPTGKNFEVLTDELVKLALKRKRERDKTTFSFTTNILENFNGTKGAKGAKR